MDIYYPSVENGASVVRRDRHQRVADFLTEKKGVTLHGRPSERITSGMSWLRDMDGVIVERLNFTSQIDRECRFADKIGKEVLILLDRDPTRSSGARGPSERLREVAYDSERPESWSRRVHIVESHPPRSGLNELTIVRMAIGTFLLARFGWQGPNPEPDRLAVEPEPFKHEDAGLEFDAAYEEALRRGLPPQLT